tara:strand:- start:5151 stop:6050 length:900 start_codon:yes stop_codon:yes gene_type:complete
MATYESKKYATIPIEATQVADGTVSNTEYQHLDGVTSDIQTQLNSISTSGLPTTGGTMTGNLSFGDEIQARFGAGNDLRIYHNNSGSADRIESDNTLQLRTDTFRVQNAAGTENIITGDADGAVNLKHNDSTKIATTSTGATVSGTLSATTFSGSLSGNGSSITNINASNISSGTLSSDRISGNFITGSGSPGYYAQRAWVRFNSNSSNSIYGSQNVSSITDHGVGKYTVNFSTAMPNSNYGIIVTPSSQAGYFAVDINGWIDSTGAAPSTSSVRVAIFTDYSLAYRDTDNVVVSVFGV